MSKKQVLSKKAESGFEVLAIILVLLPLIAFVPNTNVPVFFDHHLPTKELAYLILALITIGAAVWKFFRQPADALMPRLHLALFATLFVFLVWQLISLAWAPNLGYGLRDISVWMGVGILLMLGLQKLHEQPARWLQTSLVALALILAITQIIEYYNDNPFPSVFFNYGITAELLATLFPFQLALYLSSNSRPLAVTAGVSAVLGWLCLCETLRRGAMAGAILSIILIGVAILGKWIKPRSPKWIFSIVAALLIVTTLQLSGLIRPDFPDESNGLKYRLNDAIGLQVGDSQSSSLFERVRYWAIGWEMVKQHPLRGVGVAGYPSEYMPYRRFYLENPSYRRLHQVETAQDEFGAGALAHNEYVQILTELGFPGLILFMVLAGLVITQLWQRRNASASYVVWGATAGLAAFSVSSAVSSFSFRQAPTAAVAICLLVLGLAQIEGKKKVPGEPMVKGQFAIPKAFVATALCFTFVLCSIFTWYAYRVIQGVALQAQTEGNFSPNNPARNEAWLKDYEQVFSYDPYNRGAHFGCSVLLYRMKRPQEAAQHLETAIRLGYTRPFSKVFLAFSYEQMGRLDKAVPLIEESLASFPNSPLSRTVYIEYLRQQGRTDEMRRQQEILKQASPQLAQAQPWLMRKNLFAAVEEAQKLNLPSPYDAFPEGLEKGLLQMRAFHYIQ